MKFLALCSDSADSISKLVRDSMVYQPLHCCFKSCIDAASVQSIPLFCSDCLPTKPFTRACSKPTGGMLQSLEGQFPKIEEEARLSGTNDENKIEPLAKASSET
jgi:hypothetical protein